MRRPTPELLARTKQRQKKNNRKTKVLPELLRTYEYVDSIHLFHRVYRSTRSTRSRLLLVVKTYSCHLHLNSEYSITLIVRMSLFSACQRVIYNKYILGYSCIGIKFVAFYSIYGVNVVQIIQYGPCTHVTHMGELFSSGGALELSKCFYYCLLEMGQWPPSNAD
jgi:hypothetical protein